jgi:hypothetical protein
MRGDPSARRAAGTGGIARHVDAIKLADADRGRIGHLQAVVEDRWKGVGRRRVQGHNSVAVEGLATNAAQRISSVRRQPRSSR